jgi:hypothetical protein
MMYACVRLPSALFREKTVHMTVWTLRENLVARRRECHQVRSRRRATRFSLKVQTVMCTVFSLNRAEGKFLTCFLPSATRRESADNVGRAEPKVNEEI